MKRNLSEVELEYLEELDLFDRVINTTSLISLKQHGIQTDGRGLRAMRLFTRQTLTGLSLQKILPRPNEYKSIDEDVWDICSIASLTRNLVEGYLSLHYFGIEKINESEAQLRFFILQLHKNVEWYNIRKDVDLEGIELKQFEDGIIEQKKRIENHPYLSELTVIQKKRAIQGVEMYKTKFDFEKEVAICKDLRRDYRHLSNLVHPLPLSIERIDNENGRGIGSSRDISYCLICLMIARRYFAATTIGIADYFYDELAMRFAKELDSIRPFVNKKFTE